MSSTEPLRHEDLLLEIIRSLVTDTDAVEISVTENNDPEDDTLRLCIRVAPSDLGKVIGKTGATLEILRNLFMRIGAADEKLRILLDIDPTLTQTKPVRRHRASVDARYPANNG